jgi:homopolymeric O-antigen transport system ATP-binding protein
MIDVRFDQVGKRYRIERPDLRVRPTPAALLRRRTEDFWAVRDVSFEVRRGETLGIVGHNGAGKSTLLKLLSRITAPTTGEITLTGTLAALIEVGSGFHPELTGRENIFLSGSILGMKRREIAEKLDRIVSFSGVGAFIDTPVKRYSSGMFVRLGFSVAAHLEPDILLVDEVLSVGDAAFQVQCHERLNELRRSGKTMMFISHDLASIERLCDRVILMQQGRLVACGSPHEIVEQYQRMVATSRVSYEAVQSIRDAVIEVFFYSRNGRTLHCQCTTALSGGELTLTEGHGSLEFVTPETGLQPGVYSIGALIRSRLSADSMDWFYRPAALSVEPGKSVRGYFYTPHAWTLLTSTRDDEPAAAGMDAFHGRRPRV